MTRFRPLALFAAFLIALAPALVMQVPVAQAAASMYISAPSSVIVGNTVTLNISVNTNGASANSFDGTVSYPAGLFEGVRGSYSGSICTLQISQPDPSGGTANFTCGRPGGYTGTGLVVSVVLKAIAAGSGTFGLSGCQVLANDGQGTSITGGCSGSSVTVTGSAAPNPTPTPPPANNPTPTPNSGGGTNPTPRPSSTPRPSATPKPGTTPTPNVNQATQGAEQPNVPGETSQDPANPDVTPLSDADKALDPNAQEPIEGSSEEPQPDTTQRRSIATAFGDFMNSFKELGSLKKDIPGLAVVLISLIPVLGMTLAAVFFLYRIYIMERRRRRTLDRLFEMELSELAALEGKLDLLAEKGAKGREQYRQEFQQAKENILRQLRPDYNKPIDAPKKAKAAPDKPAEPAAN